jgi:sec-independent protein translocase protein TatB
MHFADSIFIFLLALILFGPKKLPEIARQIGKLMVEFRRASNEFKSQIDEELRVMEQQERQKKLEAAASQAAPSEFAPPVTPPSQEPQQPVIMPPSTGETVSASQPFLPVAPPEMLEAAASEPHPTYAEALASEKNGDTPPREEPENTQATLNHG